MSATLGQVYLESVIKRQMSYKTLGDMTFSQLEEKDFHYRPNPESNSIAIIINHLSGNMLSRWTNFLTEDGEKPGRNRDEEFAEPNLTKEQLLERWEKGWACLLGNLGSLKEEDLLKTITIRHEPLLAVDAINRQLAHYPHHVGQIIYIGKMIRGAAWQSLSISKGASQAFNQFMQDKHARR
ncbi:MAG: DUF1572 family protein [Bacteroidetes bacterium]|nr:DUF1572 family protein [Bacteroidota bacterium]